MKPDSVFKFRMPDGSVEINTDTDYLKSKGLSNEAIEERKKQKEAFFISEMYNERNWRNNELDLTDKLTFEDATYNGQKVRESNYLTDILEYRNQLRDYDLKYQPRPVRPDWFNG